MLGTSQRLSRRTRVLGGGREGSINRSEAPTPFLRGSTDMAKMGMKKSGGGKAKMMSPFTPAFPMKNAGNKKASMAKRSSGKSR